MTLVARSLCFGYRTPVLRDLTVTFHPGRVALVLGPNGSGKTTLLRLLLGLIDPGAPPEGIAQGSCTLDGTPIRDIRPRVRARHLAYIPHHPQVGYAYTVQQYVSFSQAAHRPDGRAVSAAMDRLDLNNLVDVPLLELSAGQMQRASIARAVAQIRSSSAEPRFLLADEPTSALDPRHVALVLAMFGSLTKEGVGIVMTMHDLANAGSIADDVCMLSDRGMLAAEGRPDVVLVPEVLERVFQTRFGVIENDGRRVIVRRDVAETGAGSPGMR